RGVFVSPPPSASCSRSRGETREQILLWPPGVKRRLQGAAVCASLLPKSLSKNLGIKRRCSAHGCALFLSARADCLLTSREVGGAGLRLERRVRVCLLALGVPLTERPRPATRPPRGRPRRVAAARRAP